MFFGNYASAYFLTILYNITKIQSSISKYSIINILDWLFYPMIILCYRLQLQLQLNLKLEEIVCENVDENVVLKIHIWVSFSI